MRYRSCTKDDIAFLRTRVASDRVGHPHLDSVIFRNVSVITAWNVHKDSINQLGAKRFAEDTGQELFEFYSIDRLSPKAVEPAPKWKNLRQAHLKRISPKLQEQLWNAAPSSTSDHVPGCLRLCVGMPVMIKSNDATELCITKGQEAIVRGWTDFVGIGGKRVLETLFVELIKPPQSVQLPGLPPNVVPLPRTSSKLTTLLEDDAVLTITRDQVLVLQNFSMTDYGAQGKSRDVNVVHLNNCKNHMGYYVCLSRGTNAAYTAIIQGFEDKVITGGLPGHIRQEFRELEMLDEITRLKQTGGLPPHVTGVYRGQLLGSFKHWKKGEPDPAHFHAAIRQDPKVSDSHLHQDEYDTWKPTVKDNAATGSKRKAPQEPKSRKKAKTATTLADNASDPPAGKVITAAATMPVINMPVGLIWDSTDYSCGYDALFTPLGHLWRSDRTTWTRQMSDLNPMLSVWCTLMKTEEANPEIPRNRIRTLLHFLDPLKFPVGPNGVLLDNLLGAVSSQESFGSAVTYCEACGFTQDGRIDTLNMLLVLYTPQDFNRRFPGEFKLTDWLTHHMDRYTGRCPTCREKLRRRTMQLRIPPILFITTIHNLVLEEEIHFNAAQLNETIRLAGLVYFSEAARHFISITIALDGTMWYHDGITTKRRCTRFGNISTIDKLGLHRINDYVLTTAIYAKKMGEIGAPE
ncbi:hypothetical protein C8R46DRAFT_924064 [Mycena filopes]|nr:hypothetical protein C8R46DRAFT_924064 [Mycena filopes]